MGLSMKYQQCALGMTSSRMRGTISCKRRKTSQVHDILNSPEVYMNDSTSFSMPPVNSHPLHIEKQALITSFKQIKHKNWNSKNQILIIINIILDAKYIIPHTSHLFSTEIQLTHAVIDRKCIFSFRIVL